VNHLAGIFAPTCDNRFEMIELSEDASGLPAVRDVYREAGLVMAQYSWSNTSERVYRSPSGNMILWDGRLDNRQDLVDRLHVTPDYTDAMLVAAIYEAGGEASLGELIGDWSTAIWDPSRRTLVLASDYVGVRPLYYRFTGGCYIWASSLDHLFAIGGDADIEDDYFCEYLTRGGSHFLTPYHGVYAVPPGCAVVVDERNCAIRPIWRLNPHETLRFHDDQDYILRFRELFEEAVAVRLRTPAPVYAELSGGLDSSAIVSVAHKLITERRVQTSRLVALSYRHEGTRDERFYKLVTRTVGIEAIEIDVQSLPFVTATEAGGMLPQPWERRHRQIAGYMKENGGAVLLTGQTGDLVMGNWRDDSEQVGDLIRNGAFVRAACSALAWSPVCHRPVYSILWQGVRLNLPWGKSCSPFAPTGYRYAESSINPHWKSRNNNPALEESVIQGWQQEPPSRRKHFFALCQVLAARTLQTPEPLRHIHYTHPYAHRRLVEYMLGVPSHIVAQPGEPRRLMRRALAGLVPAPVLARRSKASFDLVFASALRPLAAALLESFDKALLVRRGIVDPVNLRSRLGRYLSGLECNASQLRLVILAEYWLRTREAGGARAGCGMHLRSAHAFV